jgi:DNA (cytosine-5)-methyltransferase 1
MDFLRFVKSINPSFFVIENVRGILSSRTKSGLKVINIIQKESESLGYNIDFKILNSAWFGVPQMRERVFFIGVRKDLPFNSNLLFPEAELNKQDFVTVEEAIMDLPKVQAGGGSDEMEYALAPHSDYSKWARGKCTAVKNHVAMRHTDRIINRFKVIQCGQSVSHVPQEHSQRKRGDASVFSGKTFGQNNMRVFPNLPSPTIPASFQSNFIHPYEDRNFTAREGARLQSFPDDYVFRGSRTTMSWEKNLSQYQQIGNAVPPLLAFAIAKTIKRYFSQIGDIQTVLSSRGSQLDLFGPS